ncbi:maleylacetate reductase [Dinoroseobacter sp. S76]|uniref:maleylacetate reductase n=1 Tax=Dinoroseobacter sp. S76 TaxID=3415124 RepID=UPI003C7D3D64
MSFFQREFVANSAQVRVRFGPGVRHELGAEIARIGAKRALILSTPQQSETALAFAERIGARAAGVFTGARMHTPVSVTEEALRQVAEARIDCLVAVGGGSTTGLAKAIAYRTDLPQIVVPTTYAGSEATPILGQTEAGRKTTLKDPKVQPEVILYDAELVASLPVPMTVTSALNAIAHAAEGLYAQDRNPLSTALALEGVRALVTALPRVLEDPADLDARGETLYGAWLCGTVLGQVGMALHHKLCHTLGGSFDLPHAETHAVILPHAIAYNAQAAAAELAPMAALFGAESAGAGLHAFATRMGAPTRLADLGLAEADLGAAAEIATQNAYWNPAPLTQAGLHALLEAAFHGHAPNT